MSNIEVKYGLPKKVKFCNKCVISNQRPGSSTEFKHNKNKKHNTINFDEEGVCDACRFAEKKENKIDWNKRESELLELLDKHRRTDGYYDCIIPGSGGKDSVYASHILKYKYGMNPLTVTWPPILYTDIGYKNFRSWLLEGGFNNISFNYNPKVHALITKLSINNLFHPFQPFMLGQKNLAPKMALKYNIPLVFYGENEAEYGNPIADNNSSLRNKSYYSIKEISNIYLGGVQIKKLFDKYQLNLNDIEPYLPAKLEELNKRQIEVRYLGYYLKWTPQEAYYYAVENSGFKANTFRTEGTYSKYNSLDDKIDGLHYYTTYIKFGLGRATYDASQEIRNKHLTREEGIALVNKFDGEFPKKYFQEIMNYIGMNDDEFYRLADKFRSPHIWKKEDSNWSLRHKIN